MPRLVLAATAAALAVALIMPVSAVGQTDTDFYFHGSQTVGIVIHLDTVGVLPRPGADSADVVDAASVHGLILARILTDGLYVFGLALPLSRPDLFAFAANVETTDSTLVEYAGPLLRMAAGDFVLVATSQVIVQYDSVATVSQIDSLNAANGVLVAFKTPFKPNHFLLQLTPRSSGDVLQIAQLYSQHPIVEYAYPNFLGGGASAGLAAPNDEFFPEQWHLENSGGNGGIAGADIQAVDAWDLEVGDASVVIAVIEVNGFEVDHPDLAPNLWDNPGELGGDEDNNLFMGDVNGWNFGGCKPPLGGVASADDPGLTIPCGSNDLGEGPLEHGTAVAGLAAARGNNEIGVTGVCQLCSLMLIRTSMAWYSKYLAFLYAAAEGAHVINASWTQTALSAVTLAIDDAASTTPTGIPVVFAANDQMGTDVNECTGANPTFASLPDVIAVSWTNNKDERVSPSGYGDCIDVMAPGAMVGALAGVTTTDTSDVPGYNSANPIGCPAGVTELPNRAYTRCFGGSSAAAPIVSGTIGLMLSKEPSLSRQEITTRLHDTAEKVGPLTYTNGFNEYYGYGRVNAFCALGGQGPRCPAPPETAVAATVEIGTRLGFTALSGQTNDRTVTNIPGSGPLSLGVIYVSWFPANPWMVELQLGGANSSNSSGPDQREFVVALQPAYLLGSVGAGSLYLGPSLAGHLVDTGTGTQTDAAWGIAVGYRFLPFPFLALRVEGRYRHWIDQSINEFGTAFQFGVVLP